MFRNRPAIILSVGIAGVIGILVGFVALSVTGSGQTSSVYQTNYSESTIYGYGLSMAKYNNTVLSSVYVNRVNPSSDSLDFVFAMKPSSVSVMYCGVMISRAHGVLEGSGCVESPIAPNSTFLQSNGIDYQYQTSTVQLPASASNNAGLEADVIYSFGNQPSMTYSYFLFYRVAT